MATTTRRPLVAGNWKMNFTHLEAIAHVQKLAFSLTPEDVAAVEVTVLPPFTALRSVQTLVDADKLPISYGAQDLSPHPSGAYTGDISSVMLAKLGCSYVLVGHSERRQYHAEDDALIAAKVKAALDAELTPILCVGEELDVRQAGNHLSHILDQLHGALEDLPAEHVSRLVIAYEPIWAIGTGQMATPADAQEACAAIRTWLAQRYSNQTAPAVRLIYGGSVKAANIARLMAQSDIDGVLPGGASLDIEEFVGICRYREQKELI